MTIKLGVLISGGGTTLLNLQQLIDQQRLDAKVVCVISSRRDAAGVARARALGLPVQILTPKGFPHDQAYSAEARRILREQGVELVVLAGFLRVFLPAPEFSERCINIHPSLIPSFCGLGFYGMKVHEAVWKKGCKISGCTVHLVNEHYDEGTIILQKAIALADDDTPETIQHKVFQLECQALPEAIRLFAEGRIRFENQRAHITPSLNHEIKG